MPEQRARKHHQDRVAETLREEIVAMLEGELSDPRIRFGYVTEVVLGPGGKNARVYIAVDGTEQDERDMLAGLEAARGYIRHELLHRMAVRHVPELFFQIDRSGPVRARIDELLYRASRRSAKPRNASAPDSPDKGASK